MAKFVRYGTITYGVVHFLCGFEVSHKYGRYWNKAEASKDWNHGTDRNAQLTFHLG